MILYMHHQGDWGIKGVITDAQYEKEYGSIQIIGGECEEAITGGKAVFGRWEGLFVMNLETGEIVHDEKESRESAYKLSPWLKDPTIRAIKVAEYLNNKNKQEKG